MPEPFVRRMSTKLEMDEVKDAQVAPDSPVNNNHDEKVAGSRMQGDVPDETIEVAREKNEREPRYPSNSGFGQELYRRIAEARDISSGHLNLGYAVTTIIIGSIVGFGFLLLTTAVPIAMIAIGASYLHDCPAIPELPILLIVAGSIFTAGSLINIIDQFLEGYVYHVGRKRKSHLITFLNVLIVGFMVAALVLLCIYIYGNPHPAEYARVNHHHHYCHPTVYQFSYWLLNVAWVLIGLVGVLILVGVVSASFL